MAALLGISPRYVRDLIKQGKFPGAFQEKTKQKPWKIPAEEVAAVLAEREVEVEVLPPEGLEVIPQQTARDFVLSIFREATVEVELRNREEAKELRKELTEAREEVRELTLSLAEVDKRNTAEVAAVWGKVAEMEKKKPSWIARWLGRG